MWHIQNCNSYEYITCKDDRNAVWTHRAHYQVFFDQPTTEECPDSIIGIPLLIQEPELAISAKYQLPSFRLFEPYREVPIAQESLIQGVIPLDKILDLNTLIWWFETLDLPYFDLEIVIRKDINSSSLLHQNHIIVDIHESAKIRQITISNQIPKGRAEIPPSLKYYRQVVGNLDKEIIQGITMFVEGRSESWEVNIDKIKRPFDTSSLQSLVSQALRIQSHPVLERVSTFLKKQYPESVNHTLEVAIQIPEIHAGEKCKIAVTLRDPSQEYYRTGIEVLDNCMANVHQKLLEYGIPVGPEYEKYQKVLVHLLRYRQNCASQPNYIDADVAKMTENAGFHKHLHSKLIGQLFIEAIDRVFSEVDIGNSRVDLLIENIPTELKLEDRKRITTTDDIVKRYQRQAADYIARQNAAFGFLVVLDTVLDRELPTSRVDQDVCVVQVPNVSGGSVVVIAIVVRIPRSASNFTVLARKRR